MKNLIPILVLNFLIFGCASKGGIVHPTFQRTIDMYDDSTSVYYNKSIPLRIAFPKGEWIIYSDPKKAPIEITGFDIEEYEKETGLEWAMAAVHVSTAMHLQLSIEHGVRGLSPIEYLKAIKGFYKDDFAGITENFTRERKIEDQICAEWEYREVIKEKNVTIDITTRELVFLRNNYACRLRIGMLTTLSSTFKVKMENILNNVSFIFIAKVVDQMVNV